ncbi:PhzF family phenazine biosynthesis protein [Leptospira sp. FAT2]|uniref:PhzF family phenazine biosynthesis protein n=1 Tax=Leptospira sanjuanensis TaxID=2879643 RepID=UPI001EE7BD98|nr:PhzF family phenazine biosynthesis protein [Leptospira sanjuanensis]MCG6191836.1 PhzF family phenazine biosynthesis protein [Leptospira sanjuanensis]
MKLRILQIDAFAQKVFQGNPAAVCPLQEWISDERMQKIAMENNLSETVFFVREGESYRIRWFTPLREVDLCGHATLATAFYLFDEGGFTGDRIRFQSLSGELNVFKKENVLYLDFPSRKPALVEAPEIVLNSFSIRPKEVWKARDYMLVYENETQLREVQCDIQGLRNMDALGVILTCPGSGEFDFLSRFFSASIGLAEDPVTGSSHCTLIPFWSERLGKKSLQAYQASSRGGKLFCENLGERVRIGGTCVSYLEGWIEI